MFTIEYWTFLQDVYNKCSSQTKITFEIEVEGKYTGHSNKNLRCKFWFLSLMLIELKVGIIQYNIKEIKPVSAFFFFNNGGMHAKFSWG